MKVNKVEVVK